MHRGKLSRARLGLAILALVASIAGTGAAAATPAPAPQALPTPLAFTSYLDLECFRTDPYTPPPVSLVLSHLNPVLADLPRFTVTLGTRTQLCAPVAKNDKYPPPDVLDFVRYVDLACYQIDGAPLNYPITLNHLNPLLEHLPRKSVRMAEPEQLCLPVIKNGVVPPAEVLRLARYIDLACFRIEPPEPLGVALTLTQLNPVLRDIPPTDVRVWDNRQLCVPVRKNDQFIPDDVLRIVQWVDLEKYDIIAPPLDQNIFLRLQHINPLLTGLPVEPAQLLERHQLALPVAKNGNRPPG